jgi:hypothetical protein
VAIPQEYEITFSKDTYTYTLPAYVQPPFRVYTRDDQTYSPPSYTIMPGQGGWKLQFNHRPPDGEGVIVWNLRNAPLPTNIPLLHTTIAPIDETIVLSASLEDAPTAGYVKIETEYILYTSWEGSTLSGCTRGILSTAGIHFNGVPVQWCVAMPSSALRTALINDTLRYLHRMMLSNAAASKEADYHQQMVSYYTDEVEKFWRDYSDHTYSARIRPSFIDHGMTL